MIFVKKDIFEKVKNYNLEDCGFIFGYNINGNIYIDELKKADNVSKNENEYRIGCRDIIKTIFSMVIKRFDEFGIFHIHKNSFFPSEEDLKNAVVGFLYMIYCENNLFFFKYGKKGFKIVKGEII